MSAAAIAEAMKKAGCTLDQIIAALKEFEDGKRTKWRAANARRQAEFRARRNESNVNNASNAVTQHNVNNAVTPVTSVTENESPSRARSLCEESNIKNRTTNVVLQKDRAIRRSRIPADWQPDDLDVAYAQKLGMAAADIRAEREKFLNHHIAKATMSASWNASWRTWCGNWKSWGQPRAGPNGRQSKADPYSQIFAELNGFPNEPDYHSQDFGSGDFGAGAIIENGT